MTRRSIAALLQLARTHHPMVRDEPAARDIDDEAAA
ncbi:hypothetical protein ABID76_006003 [Burkholderia ambifaria]